MQKNGSINEFASLILGKQPELPSVFRLPTGRVHATSFHLVEPCANHPEPTSVTGSPASKMYG